MTVGDAYCIHQALRLTIGDRDVNRALGNLKHFLLYARILVFSNIILDTKIWGEAPNLGI